MNAHTLALLCRAQSYPHQLQLVDLVGERLDEGVVDGQSLRCALGLGVVFHQQIRQFVPQFPLPEILKVDKVVLESIRSSIALVAEEVEHLLIGGVVHDGWLSEDLSSVKGLFWSKVSD